MTSGLRSTNRIKLGLFLVVIGLIWAVMPAQARLLPDNFPFSAAVSDKVTIKNTSAAADGYWLYRVRRGDNLLSIARTHSVDCKVLAQLNGIDDPDRIQAGQRIRIPNPRTGAAKKETPTDRGLLQGLAVALQQQPSPSRTAEWPLGGGLEEGLDWIDTVWILPSPTEDDEDGWQWPLDGTITLSYGSKDADGFHHGLDIAAPAGEPIRAAEDGRVVFAGWRQVYGQTVVINHGNGMASLYAHASRLLVEEEDQVSAGQEIALVGNTGNSRGAHLHFEIYQNGKTVNPARYLPAR